MRDCARSYDYVRALRVFRLPKYAKFGRLLTAAAAFHPRALYKQTPVPCIVVSTRE